MATEVENFINTPPCKIQEALEFKNLEKYLDYLATGNSHSFKYFSKKIEILSKVKDECDELTREVNGHSFRLDNVQNSLESHANKLLAVDEKFEQTDATMNGILHVKESLEEKAKEIEKIILMNKELVEQMEVKFLILTKYLLIFLENRL